MMIPMLPQWPLRDPEPLRPGADRRLFDLSVLVRGLESAIKPVVTPPLSLHLDLARGLPPILGEPAALSLLVAQLVQNAAEASSASGVIQLRTLRGPPTSVSGCASARGWAILEVADTGEGLSAESLERIFDPTFSTKGPDRGHGMATVRAIVERHGGAIQVTSQPAMGTRVRAFFPLADGPTAGGG